MAVFFLVEVWGVEPQSENQTTGLSTCVFCVLTFPLPCLRRRSYGFSSFIRSHLPQSLGRLVPCFCSAGYLRRRRLRADVRGLKPRKLRFRSCQLIFRSRFIVVQGHYTLILPSESPSKPVHPHIFSDPCGCEINLCRQRRARYLCRNRALRCRRAYRRASCPCKDLSRPLRGRLSDRCSAGLSQVPSA